MKPNSTFKTTVYQILEAAPPNYRVSRLVKRFTILLVLLNTLALALSFIHLVDPKLALIQTSIRYLEVEPEQVANAVDFLQSKRIYFFGLVEALSTAFFVLEYLLRLWSASESRRFRGRFRFGLRFLLLIDLAATLPFVVLLLTPSRDVTIRILRIGWAIRHLKLIRYLRQPPVVEASCDALLSETEAHLAEVRREVAHGREQDLIRVDQCIGMTSQQCAQALIQHGDLQMGRPRPLSALAQREETASLPFIALVDDLETALTDEIEVESVATLIREMYRRSATVFHGARRREWVDVSLDGGTFVGQKRIPLRRVGRSHFGSILSRAPENLKTQQPLYVSELRQELSRIRMAMSHAFEQDDAQEGSVNLNRAINQLRDLDSPVRLAWDGLMFQLEQEHQRRLALVRNDIRRHGGPAFYLGRFGRWLLGSLAITRHLLELPKRLWALLLRLRRSSFALTAQVMRPAFEKLGLVKTPTLELLRAFDAARLDNVLERGLPADYLDHFAFDILQDDALFLGLDEEFANINLAIGRWREKHQSSFIVYGHRGVGKSTLLYMARQRLLADDIVIHDIIQQKITTPDAVVHYLAQRFDLRDVHDFEALAEGLIAGPPCAILLEDCHHLFFRNIGGLEAIRYFFWLIAKTNHHILWGIAIETRGYDFLNRVLPLNELFHVQIGLNQRSGEELRRLMMMRHSRSGRSLHYLHDKRNEKALQQQLRALREQRRFGRANLQEALERAYFNSLATACDGNITVALFYWLRSLQEQSPDRFDVQPFEELDLSLIWDLSQNDAFLLVAILQHGELTAEELAQILDADDIDVRLELEILDNHNILQLDYKTETFEVNPRLSKNAVFWPNSLPIFWPRSYHWNAQDCCFGSRSKSGQGRWAVLDGLGQPGGIKDCVRHASVTKSTAVRRLKARWSRHEIRPLYLMPLAI